MAKKILVVDDERHIVRLLEVNLQRTGYTVVTAFDGREALQKVESEKPDLVILDIEMPFIDGFEVLRQVKENPSTEAIPVMILTKRATMADVKRGWDLGCEAYYTKPFNPMEVMTQVKRSLDGFTLKLT